MLLYYMFWMFMCFTLHFYIIFGTNLLTGGLARITVFLPISVFRRKGIPNGDQMEWNLWERDFWNKHDPEDLEWTSRSKRGSHEGLGRPPPSWAPRGSPDRLLSPTYTHIPRKHPGSHRRNISATVTFCIREIPSWSLRRSSAGRGIFHGVLLHQHHCLTISYE